MNARRVLLVEDDDRTRAAMGMILSGAGYGIVEAGSVKTALMHLDIIDLSAVVLDLRLPNGHGRKVVEELLAKRNDVPVVIVSGFPQEAPEDSLVVAILGKPFKRDELLAAVMKARETSDAIKSMRSSTRSIGRKILGN